MDEYLRDGGNRDASGHFLSWLTHATAVYGYLTDVLAYNVGTPESYVEAQLAFRSKENWPAPLRASTRGLFVQH